MTEISLNNCFRLQCWFLSMLPWKRINVTLAFHPIMLILPNSNSPAIFTPKSNLKPFAHRHTNKSVLSLGLHKEMDTNHTMFGFAYNWSISHIKQYSHEWTQKHIKFGNLSDQFWLRFFALLACFYLKAHPYISYVRI